MAAGLNSAGLENAVGPSIGIGSLLASTSITTMIMAALAISGVVSGSALGATMLAGAGFSILGMGALTCLSDASAAKKIGAVVIAILVCSTTIILGGLGVSNMISGKVLGWILVGPAIAGLGIGYLASSCAGSAFACSACCD